MGVVELGVPGVYRRPHVRRALFPRVRTDVAGFVGVAGAAHLHEPVRCDDWRDYVEAFLRAPTGDLLEPPVGSRLTEAVRAYFANGGARCWIVNVAASVEAAAPQELLADMLGLPREPPAMHAGQRVRHVGLEMLLQQDEVSYVLVPELHATVVHTLPRLADDLPPLLDESRFFACDRHRALAGVDPGDLPPERVDERPFFTPDQIAMGQRLLLERLQREPWRAMALLEPPPDSTWVQAWRWRQLLQGFQVGAMYWPWTLVQEAPGLPVRTVPPSFSVAGVFARRDLAVGPHVAPANESLHAVVGLEREVSDEDFVRVYDGQAGPDEHGGLNVLRSFAGRGIQVWGARNLSFRNADTSLSDPLSFVPGRRCLTAIERNVERIGQRAVFEPNLPLLRAQVTQAIAAHLLTVAESGALAGDTAEQSFFVRCDQALNPPELVDQGRLLCEVGVALAVPAEFVVFRVGRREGVVEIEEVTR